MRHVDGCVIIEAGIAVGIACAQCAAFWPCSVMKSVTGELVAAVVPGEENGCQGGILTNEEWESAVKAQVMRAGLAASPD